MTSSKVLFISKSSIAAGFFSELKAIGFEAGLADTLKGALQFVQAKKPELIFSESTLPGYRVEQLLEGLASQEKAPPVYVTTEQGSAIEAKKLLDLGAKDYWLAPLTWDKIQAVLPQKKETKPVQKTAQPLASQWEVIGNDPSMLKILALAKRIAPSNATVFIAGESGTGKEMIARFIHGHSPRKDKTYLAVNCAALPEHLLESELFGHEKGAFTGAIQRKPGKFEIAHEGTLLLDEISEMDLGLQAKLLRVLQESEVDRVGGTEPIKVNVRVLATTNRDIAKSVEEGEFRQDLYYRLNVIPINLPPLRNRGDDVLLLAEHFLKDFIQQYGLKAIELTEGARSWLREYTWPGNVRELQNLMERAVLLAAQGVIEQKHFLADTDDWEHLDISEEARETQPVQQAATQSSDQPILPLHEMEKNLILKSLDHTEGNRTQAADLLGISVRTLRNKLNEYRKQGIEV